MPTDTPSDAIDGGSLDAARRLQLGEFLRARRAAVQPEDLGLPRGGRRRVAGLRRDEVASMAGVSTTWYTWLEQGREVRASPRVVDALARALALSPDAHQHLRRLAAADAAPPAAAIVDVHQDAIQWLCDELAPNPVCVISRLYDYVAWNEAYARLIFDPMRVRPEQRNALWMLFLDDQASSRFVDLESARRDSVAYFREESGNDPGDPRSLSLVAELSSQSPQFRALWHQGEVRRYVGYERLVIRHRAVGDVTMEVVNVRLTEPPIWAAIHRLVDDESRSRVETILSTERRVS